MAVMFEEDPPIGMDGKGRSDGMIGQLDPVIIVEPVVWRASVQVDEAVLEPLAHATRRTEVGGPRLTASILLIEVCCAARLE